MFIMERYGKDMINLLHSELYKLRKSKSYKVAAALSVLFVLFTYALFGIMQNMGTGSGNPGMMEIVQKLSGIGIMDIMKQMFANCNAIIFATIFMCIFVINDYSSGAIKNFVGKGYRREEVYLAKFFVTELGAVTLYMLVAVSVLVLGIAYFGPEQLTGAFWTDFGNYLTMQILYLTGYTAINVFVCAMARNMASGVLISVLGIMMFSGPILSGLDYFLGFLGVDFGISQYWIMSVISNCPVADIPSGFIVQSGIVAGGWLAAAMAGGMILFSKRDI